jgi:hypothetical protein
MDGTYFVTCSADCEEITIDSDVEILHVYAGYGCANDEGFSVTKDIER